MEIDEKKLRDILEEQQEKTEKTINAFREDVDKKFTETDKTIRSFRKDVDKKFIEQKEQTERYIGSLKEDFDHKLDVVFEYIKDIPGIKQQQNMMFEQMGRMMEDITVIKETVKDHEVRMQKHEIV